MRAIPGTSRELNTSSEHDHEPTDAAAINDPLHDSPISPFKIPSFYRQTSTRKKRSVPFCRILTDDNIINEKRAKMREKEEAEEKRKIREQQRLDRKSKGKTSKGVKVKGKGPSKKKKSMQEPSGSENVQCLFCEGWFLDGMGGNWCMCISCKQWSHCECAGLEENDQSNYTCDVCRQSKK